MAAGFWNKVKGFFKKVGKGIGRAWNWVKEKGPETLRKVAQFAGVVGGPVGQAVATGANTAGNVIGALGKL